MSVGRGRGSDRRDELRPVAGRSPPHDLEAERAVLGAVLLDVTVLDRVGDTLAPEHFFSGAHGLIWEAMRELHAARSSVDLVTVHAHLAAREKAQQAGGIPYLTELWDGVPAVSRVEDYAAIVVERWRVRRLIATCQRVAAEGYGDVGDVGDWLDASVSAIQSVAHVEDRQRPVHIRPATEDAYRMIDAAAKSGTAALGIPTGFSAIDAIVPALRPGNLVVVAGRPGMGKTAWALNLAVNVAISQQLGALIFSLEMDVTECAMRILSSEARVSVSNQLAGRTTAAEWTALCSATVSIAKAPIWIDGTPALSLLDMRAKARTLALEMERAGTPLGIVIVDYLQLMKTEQTRNSNREQEVSALSRGLKVLAKELCVPVVALSQLSRKVEERSNKRPMLSDLRESGAIEQDADLVIFFFRPGYYAPDDPSSAGIAEAIIAKQRSGPTGTARLRFDAASTRFDNLHPGDDFESPRGPDW